jgi:predicted SAM-dependent methyltransferase
MKNSNKKLICEIGCGERKMFDGSIGVDIRRTAKTDVLADARKLPFKDGCFDHIYSSHVIEHFSHNEIQCVLIEWIRVLKDEGVFELRCPDLRARALIFFLRPSWENIKNIYGGQDYVENYHNCGFTFGLLKSILNKSGIVQINRILDGYRSIPFLPCDLHVIGVKRH